MSSVNFASLVSTSASIKLEALAAWASSFSRDPNPAMELGFASLLAKVALLDPDPITREAVISMPHFPKSALTSCLNDVHPDVRKAAVKHPAITTSAILRHLAFETNQRVIVACLISLHDLSDEQALEALGAKESDAFAEGEFYAVIRDTAEHHSRSVRVASAPIIASLLKSEASSHAFVVLEQLLCDVPRVACAAVDAMLTVSHQYKLSERVVRALIALTDAGERSALHLMRDVPCKTISGYAFLQFWMDRKVYNATGDNQRELNELFSRIVVRNETFARVLDFSKELHDKQWLWRGEEHTI